MTDKKVKQDKTGNQPTHSLFVRTEQFSKPIVIKVAAMWNNPEKGYMGVKLEELELHENPNKANNQPPFLMFVNTKIYGQDALIHIGNVIEKEDKKGFAINFGDMVVFENKPHKESSNKKTVPNKQPRP